MTEIELMNERKNKIFKEILLLSKSLSEELTELCDTGISHKHWSVFRGFENNITNFRCYVKLNKDNVLKLKKALDDLDENSSLEKFWDIFKINSDGLHHYHQVLEFDSLYLNYRLTSNKIKKLNFINKYNKLSNN